MTDPERRINTFYAFCSLLLPGLGQLLQKRVGTALGFFSLFLLSGFLPGLIVSLLFRDRFFDQPFRVHILHISVFAGLFFLFMLAVFWSVLDAAAWRPSDKPSEDKPKAKPYATLAKIFAVIVIVGVLVALLLPAVPSARESAKRMLCSNNMKEIALAFHHYVDEHGHLPPVYTVDEDGKPLHSWRVLILPYIEQNALYEKIRLDEPWDSEYNRQFHAKAPPIFRCPSSSFSYEDRNAVTVSVPAPGGCFYSVIDGAEAAFFGSQTRTFADITSGTSNTILLVERRIPVNWMDPSREITFEAACKGVNVDAMGISSYHPGVAYVALGDASVRFISDSLKSDELRKMLMIHDEEER